MIIIAAFTFRKIWGVLPVELVDEETWIYHPNIRSENGYSVIWYGGYRRIPEIVGKTIIEAAAEMLLYLEKEGLLPEKESADEAK